MKILNLYAGIGGNRKLWGDEHEITAVENDNGDYALSNRNNKHIVTVKMKGDSYSFLDNAGIKIMSGKGQLSVSLEKLLKEHYYAKEDEVKEPETPTEMNETEKYSVDDTVIIKGKNGVKDFEASFRGYTGTNEAVVFDKKRGDQYQLPVTDIIAKVTEVKGIPNTSIVIEWSEGLSGENISQPELF